MADRPTIPDDEIDRTGRDEEVTGRDIRTGKTTSDGFGAAGTKAEQPPKRNENDFA